VGHPSDTSLRPSAAGAHAPAARPVTVLAVDDQEIFRRAVQELVAATPGFEMVGEAASGPEALDRTADLDPDLVLLDVRMPGMDGIETSRRLAESCPRSVVVLVSIEAVVDLPQAVGAAAHLRKQDLSPRTLQETWRTHGAARRR
jgi:DNA-binding NarL/FixJ family response regulator